MPVRVLAVDPGLRSGLAYWHEGEFHAEIEDPMDTLDLVWRAFAQGVSYVVVEAYTITAATAQKSQQHWSLELIGAIRWMAHQFERGFVLQKPADAKNFMPDQRLKEIGFYTPGKEDHARDAARHLGLYLAKAGQLKVPPLG